MTAQMVAIPMLLLAACAAPPPPPKAEQPKVDPTTEAWYGAGIKQLSAWNREAESLWKIGRADDASATVVKAQALEAKLLAVSHPTLEAMEAASDLDDLYARMLLANHHDGWARLAYQKNVTRWKMWRPQTEDTERRLRQAQAGIVECDRRLK